MASHEKPKLVTISVNSADHQVPHEKISYDAIVELAFPGGSSSGAVYIVKYSRGSSDNETGTLPPGEGVMVKDAMRFRVSPTGES
jgi:Multiubiquitin